MENALRVADHETPLYRYREIPCILTLLMIGLVDTDTPRCLARLTISNYKEIRRPWAGWEQAQVIWQNLRSISVKVVAVVQEGAGMGGWSISSREYCQVTSRGLRVGG